MSAFDWELPTAFPPVRLYTQDGKETVTSVHVLADLTRNFYQTCNGDWDAFAPVVRATLDWPDMDVHQWRTILGRFDAWQQTDDVKKNLQLVLDAEKHYAVADKPDSSSDSPKSLAGTSTGGE